MKNLFVLLLVLCVAGTAMSDHYYWRSTTIGPGVGDGVSFTDPLNWAVNNAQATDPPGPDDIVHIFAASWIPNYPTLSGSATINYMATGEDTSGLEGSADLTITSSGSLTTGTGTLNNLWNGGIQIAWYSDSTVTSAGVVDTAGGWTNIGNAGGNGTLHITGGSWTTAHLLFGNAGAGNNHIQLDGGVLETWGVTDLHLATHTMNMTGGTFIAHIDDENWFGWITQVGLTGDDLEGTFDSGTWIITPEPTTMLLVGLGSLALLRKKR
jgi:hypothetical protein